MANHFFVPTGFFLVNPLEYSMQIIISLANKYPGTLYTLQHLILRITLHIRSYQHPHFAQEETETQLPQFNCPRSQSLETEEPRCKPSLPVDTAFDSLHSTTVSYLSNWLNQKVVESPIGVGESISVPNPLCVIGQVIRSQRAHHLYHRPRDHWPRFF